MFVFLFNFISEFIFYFIYCIYELFSIFIFGNMLEEKRFRTYSCDLIGQASVTLYFDLKLEKENNLMYHDTVVYSDKKLLNVT